MCEASEGKGKDGKSKDDEGKDVKGKTKGKDGKDKVESKSSSPRESRLSEEEERRRGTQDDACTEQSDLFIRCNESAVIDESTSEHFWSQRLVSPTTHCSVSRLG